MAEPTIPPHDQPMTWGEFRQAARAMSAFHSLVSLYSAVAISSAVDDKHQKRLEEIEKQIDQAAREFERTLGFSPDEAING